MRFFKKPSSILFLFLCFGLLSLAYSQPLEAATVLKIIDGNTLLIKFQGREEKIHLIGIDCPETQVNPKAEKEAQRSGSDIQKIIEMGKEDSSFAKSLVRKAIK